LVVIIKVVNAIADILPQIDNSSFSDYLVMITKIEAEKTISLCLEELRLLIEKPYENDALIERLSTIRNKLEKLYYLYFLINNHE